MKMETVNGGVEILIRETVRVTYSVSCGPKRRLDDA